MLINFADKRFVFGLSSTQPLKYRKVRKRMSTIKSFVSGYRQIKSLFQWELQKCSEINFFCNNFITWLELMNASKAAALNNV